MERVTVILRARELTDQHVVTHEFVKRPHRRHAEAGIVIPFPIRTIEIAPPTGGEARDGHSLAERLMSRIGPTRER